MARSKKIALWLLEVYALSFSCYLPMLLRQNGAAVPDALLSLKYLFVLIPALVSAVFLLREHSLKACWLTHVKKLSAKELCLLAATVLTGILTTCGYSLCRHTGLFGSAYPTIGAFAAAGGYLFLTALAEELAWRGFLLDRVACGRRSAPSALLVGVLWGVWHIPMWTVRNALGPAEILPLLLWTVLVSLVLGRTWFRFGNLLSVALLHASFNVCFLAPAGWNNLVLLGIIILCYIIEKYKKNSKEF